MLRVATVCSGIGAPEKALTNLGIPYELECFSEIDEAAIKSYCAIHGVDRCKNFGSLTEVNEKPVPLDIDLLVGGTPCQSFSTAGKGEGGDEGSGTRSSLMWCYLQLIALTRPKVVVWENVPGVLSQKHIHNFRRFYFALMAYGYHVYSDVLNAKYFNIPQNRARLFIIAIKKDIDSGFKFPQGYDSGVRIKHILQDEPALPLNQKFLKNLILFKPSVEANSHRIIRCGNLHHSKFSQDNTVISIDGISECLMRRNDSSTGTKIYDNRNSKNMVVRKFTPKESLRLMGFSDNDYFNCKYKTVDGKLTEYVSNAELYSQAGNSIVVTVLMAIFGVLYNVEDWEEQVYRERKKTSKQLLYELPLLEYMRGQEINAS